MAQEYKKRFGEAESGRDPAHTKGLDLLALQRAQVWFLESIKQLGF